MTHRSLSFSARTVPKNKTLNRMATNLVTVTNGLFFGRGQISATLAIRLIHEGAAELDPAEGQQPEQVFRIRMTHKGYDDIAQQRPVKATRVYRSQDSGAALSTVQHEELYMGERGITPVEHVIPVLKKCVRGRFVPWSDKEKFPRHRFNPDHISTIAAGR